MLAVVCVIYRTVHTIGAGANKGQEYLKNVDLNDARCLQPGKQVNMKLNAALSCTKLSNC